MYWKDGNKIDTITNRVNRYFLEIEAILQKVFQNELDSLEIAAEKHQYDLPQINTAIKSNPITSHLENLKYSSQEEVELILSSMQLQVEMLEAQVVDVFFQFLSKKTHKFNALNPIIYLDNQFVEKGDTLNLFAYPVDCFPPNYATGEMFVNGQLLAADENGFYHYSEKPRKTGKHKLKIERKYKSGHIRAQEYEYLVIK